MPRSWWDPNEMKITRWRNLPDGEVDFEQLDVAPIIRELLQQCADYGLTVAETESLLEMVTAIVTISGRKIRIICTDRGIRDVYKTEEWHR